MKKLYNIIVAAGSGSRFGQDLPKQYCDLRGRPVLMHTIERMRKAMSHADFVLVINEVCQNLWDDLCDRYDFVSPTIVYGGTTRWQSVKNAINAIPGDADVVMVHDGARPLVNATMIERIVQALSQDGVDGVIPVVPVIDSLRMIEPGGASIAVDRAKFKSVQTPQAFDASKLRQAYSLPYNDTFTDDASVMAAAGYDKIKLVEGDAHNIKITLPDDLKIAEIYMK